MVGPQQPSRICLRWGTGREVGYRAHELLIPLRQSAAGCSTATCSPGAPVLALLWSHEAHELACGTHVYDGYQSACSRKRQQQFSNAVRSVVSFGVYAGWFTSGAVVGGYGSVAQGGKVGPAALSAAKTWALGVPLGVAIRSIGRGYVPAMSFIGISLAVTGVLMVGWRTALAAVTPEVRAGGGGQLGRTCQQTAIC